MSIIDNFPAAGNLKVYQGYSFMTSRHSYNTMQLRILYRIIEFAQSEIEGLMLRDNRCKLNRNLRDVTLAMPVSCILDKGSHHHGDVHKAFIDIQRDIIQIVEDDGNKWRSASLLGNVSITKGSGLVVFTVPKFIWDRILDFTHGFRCVELKVVLNLRLPSSVRLYQLISGQDSPITYPLDWLKSYFGVSDKYAQPTDFMRKILVPAIQELRERAPWACTYTPTRTGRKYTHITLKPYHIDANEDADLYKNSLLATLSTSNILPYECYRYMRYNMEFSNKELNANKELLDNARKLIPDLASFLSNLQARRRLDDGRMLGKGWVINAIKSEVRKFQTSGRS